MPALDVTAPEPTGAKLDNKRVAAGLIDLAALVPISLLMAKLAGGWNPRAALLSSAWALFYYFGFESGAGQTPGKMVMGLRVVRADGSPADIGAIAVRNLLRLVDGLGAYLLGLIVMVATGQRRQRVGDLAAGTVVRLASAPAAAPEAAAPASAEPAPADPVDGEETYADSWSAPGAAVADEPELVDDPEPSVEAEPAWEPEPVVEEPEPVVAIESEPAFAPQPVHEGPVFEPEPALDEPEPIVEPGATFEPVADPALEADAEATDDESPAPDAEPAPPSADGAAEATYAALWGDDETAPERPQAS